MKVDFEPVKTGLFAGIKPARKESPLRIVLYGESGVGKTTWASHAEAPIFIGAEDGSNELDAMRYPSKIASGEDLLNAISALQREPHNFKTVVLDTLDWAEPLVWASIMKADGKAESIEEVGGGYGKGYTRAYEYWIRVTTAFDLLRNNKGMSIIVLAHTALRNVLNPRGDNYDTFDLKVDKKTAGHFREWADCVLFAEKENLVSKKKTDRNAKLVGVGDRVMHTTKGAGFFAKNRFGLPDVMPLDYREFDFRVSRSRLESDIELCTRQVETYASMQGADQDLIIKYRQFLDRVFKRDSLERMREAVEKKIGELKCPITKPEQSNQPSEQATTETNKSPSSSE